MGFFDKKYPKSFGVYRKSSTFAPAKRNKDVLLSAELGYGVMVTLQILVLSFLVRVRVPQQKKSLSSFRNGTWRFFVSKTFRDCQMNNKL